jgi:metal transporter CNNM
MSFQSILIYLLSFSLTFASAIPSPEIPDEPEVLSPTFRWELGTSVILILSGGVFAGLTLGLMGLDELHLRVLATSSDNLKEKQNAKHGKCLITNFYHVLFIIMSSA